MTEDGRTQGRWQPLCGALLSLAPKRTTEANQVTCVPCKEKLVDAKLTVGKETWDAR